MPARIASADSVDTNGPGSALFMPGQSRMACSSWRVERCVPRRMYFPVSVANQRSTWFSHEAGGWSGIAYTRYGMLRFSSWDAFHGRKRIVR